MKSNSNLIKQAIPADVLKKLQINVDGQEWCSKGRIAINGIEIASDKENGRGISSFEICLPASGEPEVTVYYHPNLVTKEVCEKLGIEKRPSYQKGN